MNGNQKLREVKPAERYVPPNDLCVVSTFFDSEGYSSKRRHLRSYLRSMENSGIRLLLVEGAFGNDPFLLPESDRVIHVRCSSIMWQKERLLNVAIENLPDECQKVAWLDTDVFFENPRWAVETAALLDEVPVVQPFDVALWLPKGTTKFDGRGIAWSGFAAVAHTHPGLFLSGDFDRHGHTGYAWAARRDLVEKHGLYDRSVVGSGDHLMTHAMMGDLSSPCVTNSVGAANPFRDSFIAWAKPFHRDVRSRIGYVRGAVLHRWHGDRKKRRYYKRMVGLLARRYDPMKDVAVSPSGGLEWTNHGAALGRWMKDYFAGRQEDGRPGHVERVPWEVLESLRQDQSAPLDEEMRRIAAFLGPLATLVSEQSAAWTGAGLTPVLPNLVASILLSTAPPEASGGGAVNLGGTGRSRHSRGSVGNRPVRRVARYPTQTESNRGSSDQNAASERLGGRPLSAPWRFSNFASGSSGENGFTREATAAVDPFETARLILEGVLNEAKESGTRAGRSWRQMSLAGKWAALTTVREDSLRRLSEELEVRIRDPRWEDAPELKTATDQLLKRRARFAGRSSVRSDPYDAVVGPGSSATGLDHV